MKDLATTLIGALTLYAVSTAGFAAAPRDDVRHQVVTFADLDLTRPRAVADVGAPLLTTRQQASTARQPLQPRQARLEE